MYNFLHSDGGPLHYRDVRLGGDMRRWYFSHHLVNGIPFALAWAEDNGLCVGGRPTNLVGDIVEISEEEFNNGLSDLEKQYPLRTKEGDIVTTPPLDDEPT